MVSGCVSTDYAHNRSCAYIYDDAAARKCLADKWEAEEPYYQEKARQNEIQFKKDVADDVKRMEKSGQSVQDTIDQLEAADSAMKLQRTIDSTIDDANLCASLHADPYLCMKNLGH